MAVLITMPIKVGVKCINCHSNFGCIYEGEKKYCKSCADRDSCRYICVHCVSGGLCASCYELSKIKRRKK
jgi:hypothetical protein